MQTVVELHEVEAYDKEEHEKDAQEYCEHEDKAYENNVPKEKISEDVAPKEKVHEVEVIPVERDKIKPWRLLPPICPSCLMNITGYAPLEEPILLRTKTSDDAKCLHCGLQFSRIYDPRIPGMFSEDSD